MGRLGVLPTLIGMLIRSFFHSVLILNLIMSPFITLITILSLTLGLTHLTLTNVGSSAECEHDFNCPGARQVPHHHGPSGHVMGTMCLGLIPLSRRGTRNMMRCVTYVVASQAFTVVAIADAMIPLQF